MKFNDGQWMSRPGYTIHRANSIRSYELTEDEIVLYVPCLHFMGRGSTLRGPLLSIRFYSPREDIIGVKTEHFVGEDEAMPRFGLNVAKPSVKVEDLEDELRLTSGRSSLRVKKSGPFGFAFYFDDLLRSSVHGMGAVAYISEGEFMSHQQNLINDLGLQPYPEFSYLRHNLSLGVNEYIYGLGERFTPFVKNGQTVDIWQADGGTSSEQAYKNVPFYLSNKNYGIFVDQCEKVSFEIGSSTTTKVEVSIPGERLNYYFIGGESLKDVLSNYTDLTGKASRLPAWSYGLWLSTSFTTDYDEDTVNHFVDGMIERNIPLSVLHYDCFWMKEYQWCDFEWDKDYFPDPEGMLGRMKAKDLHISVWINPYIGQKSPLFREAKEQGYLIKNLRGGVWQWDNWQPGMAVVDFTNPDACTWYASKLEALVDMGVDAFKTDFGERIPVDVVYHDGSDPYKMHNYYTYLYNKTVYDALTRKKGDGQACLFARSATVGSQSFPLHWGGDCDATYESMAESLRGGLSFGLGGFAFWSHDIGGFESTATADLYKRWIAFGLLSSHSRLHGSSSYRVPWTYDEEASDVLRFFTNLKCRLMPYLYAKAEESCASGLPMMRAMLLEFPEDPNCAWLDTQYMLGDGLLVAPILNDSGLANFYVPAGEGLWTDLLTGETYEGGRWYQTAVDYFHMPILIRPGHVIALGNTDDRPDYQYEQEVCFVVGDASSVTDTTVHVYSETGEVKLSLTTTREGDTLKLVQDGAAGSWSVYTYGDGGTDLTAVDCWMRREIAAGSLQQFATNTTEMKIDV